MDNLISVGSSFVAASKLASEAFTSASVDSLALSSIRLNEVEAKELSGPSRGIGEWMGYSSGCSKLEVGGSSTPLSTSLN